MLNRSQVQWCLIAFLIVLTLVYFSYGQALFWEGFATSSGALTSTTPLIIGVPSSSQPDQLLVLTLRPNQTIVYGPYGSPMTAKFYLQPVDGSSNINYNQDLQLVLVDGRFVNLGANSHDKQITATPPGIVTRLINSVGPIPATDGFFKLWQMNSSTGKIILSLDIKLMPLAAPVPPPRPAPTLVPALNPSSSSSVDMTSISAPDYTYPPADGSYQTDYYPPADGSYQTDYYPPADGSYQTDYYQ